MEHRASTCSPTLHSPNKNLALGLMETSTGTAVPETAISSLQPKKNNAVSLKLSLLLGVRFQGGFGW